MVRLGQKRTLSGRSPSTSSASLAGSPLRDRLSPARLRGSIIGAGANAVGTAIADGDAHLQGGVEATGRGTMARLGYEAAW